MYKAINAWSIDGKTGFLEMFREVKKAGFAGIELNIDKPDASQHSLTMETSQAELAEMKAMADEAGLMICSLSTSLYGSKLGSLKKEDRDFAKALLEKQLEFAQALGADGVLVVPGGNYYDGQTILSAYENVFETLSEMKPLIAKGNVKVGLENVWNGFFLSPFDMRDMIDRLDCPNLGAYFDVGNVVAASFPESWIEILGSRIVKVHVKDFARKGGFYTGGDFVDLWAGNVNWSRVIPALRQAGYEGPLTAEVFPTRKYEDITTFYKEVSEQMDRILAL
ncbi:MAG TPA: sugar phosphate isomerase/epimerase [Clostridiales bacterium]|nr:sugar phosphate isomerase/epimerase [Clostridiales bacterium]